jgi:hypothetical protein
VGGAPKFGVACEWDRFGEGEEGHTGSGNARADAFSAAAAAVAAKLDGAASPLQVRTAALLSDAFADTVAAGVAKLGRNGGGTVAVVDGLVWLLSRPPMQAPAA